jgi:hypothetical protein
LYLALRPLHFLEEYRNLKQLAILGLIASAAAASAATLWDQSQLVNMAGAGTGTIAGQSLSMLEAGETVFGNGVQSAVPNIIADDFTIGAGGAVITGFSVFAYTTGATAPNITGVNWAIGGAATTTLAAATPANSFWTSGGLNVYRVNTGDTGSTGGIREVQIATVTGLNLSLAAGTYWLSFDATPGTFSPPLPTSLATHGKNAMQSTAGGAFAPLVQGPGGDDMAFIITGNAVPEPCSMIALSAGLALLARRRRVR